MWLGDLLVLIPLLLIAIAIGLAFALRIACRRRTGESLVAGDPYFFPIGDWPTIPNYRRHLDERDFRAWGVPGFIQTSRMLTPDQRDQLRSLHSAGALRRIDGGGRPSVSLSSEQSAVVLPFRGRRV